MRGQMMDTPLLISALIRHADAVHGGQEIVSRTIEGPIHRYTYADAHRRARRLANALAALGVGAGERVGTIAWNGYRHFELYFAVSGTGAICHTMNPRLNLGQLVYIVNHAEDSYVFVDLTFVPLLEAIADKLASVKGVVVMTDRAHMPATKLANALCYEDLIDSHSDDYAWPTFDENTASSLCYTSGTTGNPKGALYSHRSTVLHSYAMALPDSAHLSAAETILSVVPMFHVNAWGYPYAAPMTGAKLVMPGPKLDGASLTELLAAENVTVTAGVPTIWLTLLAHLRESGTRLPALKRVIVGGAAVPPSMIEAFQNEVGVEVRHAWGMTEMSPLGTVNVLKPALADRPVAARTVLQAKQGLPVFGVEMTIVDERNKPLPRDGKAFGELKVRGPWVARAYFKEDGGRTDAEGWFATGDVATIDADGYMQITDRTKDLIKSGGEWISSIDLENLAMGHPDIAQAAVIAVPDARWGERPLMLVVPAPDAKPTPEIVRAFLKDKVADWWLPDHVVLVDALPLGATGKVLKAKLREDYRDYKGA
ncbi:MAG: long-chain-fatty-acid--CoA ligase [Gammaproteobacteria bacterium]|nr:long-chain-fatty-acid--CoA ligase [Gammaproteobacteria bacterium]NIR82756.1 long-chain-fatty-acid--CoA ligase [Gammaproteobacteria bacterium]NIR89620.1 long-chain-fatty-acid--CoA ligase [Gammaproteobacteria bacterium]NIU03916.1 long-chain-fatty-acid--CoA ligase [Gammaproteobacteria bacterium]NIV51232.1 long-chain-fatty-acid--CoA ligase [Gammaproteobacteria bacterium]